MSDRATELRAMLIFDEGMRLKPYLDCCGKYWRECVCEKKGILTIAAGVNLDDGLSESEALFLTDNRITIATNEARSFPWLENLSPRRMNVVIAMIFNLGLTRFRGFKFTIAAIAAGDFVGAASEMLASRWGTQVGDRAKRYAKLMRDG